ncbi:MAG: hypothetical protein E7126_08075 [Rikenellaceae bacterium]|nr:hypothetical protein [Rikenellaceae bacterium]
MKKIFFALVAIFALGACIKEDLPVTGGNPTNSEGGYVEVGFSVVLPDMKEATRAIDAPAIERLHLLVFDDQGVLADAVPATPVNGWGVSTDETKFTAKLARTGHKRTIHLVANSPTEDVNLYPMSTESSIIAAMEVSGGKDAYWQRIEFPDGIYDDGNPIYVNDIPTYYPHQDIIDKLTAVPLVRNYSRVKVVNAIPSSSTQLYNVEFVLVNIPEKGSVAPFNTNTGKFQAINASSTYATLLADSYNGYEPTGRELINDTFNGGELICEDYTDWVSATAADADSGYHYLYERNQNIDPKTPAYILVRGRYANASATPTYYKVAIINDKGVSYNLLRNIQYTVSINGVLGEGFKTAKEAYEAGPSNNLNFSVETKNLLNLSDGTRTIYVEYTQKVINSANTEVTLRYKYDDTSKTADERAQLSDTVVISVGDGNVISGNVNEGDDTTDSDGWNTLSFTTDALPAVGESAYSQIITLTAGTFAREVEFILTNPYLLKLNMPSKVPAVFGSAVAASLEIQPRLPMGIFPLEFVVVAENNSLSPDATLNTLPVVTNVNLYGQPGGNYFGYKVTLEYDDYCTVSGETTTYKTIIPLYFKTNMAESAPEIGSDDGTDCYAYNQYHNIATDEFFNGDLYAIQFDNDTYSVQYGVGKSVEATLRINSSTITDEDWTDGEYIDFVISDSNNTLTFDYVKGLATTVAEKVGNNVLRVYKSGFAGNKEYTLVFKTTKFRSATTITASNDNFTQASATLTNTGFGKLGIEVTEGGTLLPGAGQTVAVAVTVPAGAEAAFENDQLELTLTTSAAYLADPVTRASISGSGTNFTVVVSKDEYNNTTGSTYNFAFTTTDGNTAATRTIVVKHPDGYFTQSDAAQTVTKKKGLTMKFVDSNTSTTQVNQLSDDKGYYLLVELEEASDSAVNVDLIVSGINRTTLTSDGENVSNGTYTITIPAGSTRSYVQLTATMSYAQYYYSSAQFTIKADAGSDYETVTLNMTGGRLGTINRTYYYGVTVN